jgi:hypothetical protein
VGKKFGMVISGCAGTSFLIARYETAIRYEKAPQKRQSDTAKETIINQDWNSTRSRVKQKLNLILNRESSDIQTTRIHTWNISPLPSVQSQTKEDISINDEQNRNPLMSNRFTQAY